jgi:hypothetical protein
MKEVFTKLDLAIHGILSLIVSFVCIRFVVSESIILNYLAIAVSFIWMFLFNLFARNRVIRGEVDFLRNNYCTTNEIAEELNENSSHVPFYSSSHLAWVHVYIWLMPFFATLNSYHGNHEAIFWVLGTICFLLSALLSSTIASRIYRISIDKLKISLGKPNS